MSAETWAIARFTVLMASIATALVLPPAIAIGWVLARKSFPGKTLLETVVSLPLVLPPVASGLLLLWIFGRRSPVGRALDAVGIEIIFTWKAVVIAMMVISFPLVARSVRAGIEQVDRRYRHARPRSRCVSSCRLDGIETSHPAYRRNGGKQHLLPR